MDVGHLHKAHVFILDEVPTLSHLYRSCTWEFDYICRRILPAKQTHLSSFLRRKEELWPPEYWALCSAPQPASPSRSSWVWISLFAKICTCPLYSGVHCETSHVGCCCCSDNDYCIGPSFPIPFYLSGSHPWIIDSKWKLKAGSRWPLSEMN